MKSVFIATTSFARHSNEPIKKLEKTGFVIEKNDKGRKLTEAEMCKLIYKYDGVIAGTELYSEKILKKAKKLKVISRLGVGTDNINIKYANSNQISIYKTSTSPAVSVAELSLGLILDLIRNISLHNSDLKKGFWNKRMGSILSQKTLGIVGFGSVGQVLANITKGFGLNYLINDIRVNNDYNKFDNFKFCNLEELFSNSDIISVHTSLTSKTNGFINYQLLSKMKNSSFIINTSRGEIINENDLIKVIESKMIAGAALDVFSIEPYKGKLLQFDNVITTPHIAAYAKEIRSTMELEAASNLINGLKK